MKRKKRTKKTEEDFYRDIKKLIDEGHVTSGKSGD